MALRPRTRTWLLVVTTLIVALLATGAGVYFYPDHNKPSASAAAAPKPTFTSPDGRTTLTVPPNVLAPGVTASFVNDTGSMATDINKHARGFKSAGTPVNIKIAGGTLPSDQVTVRMHYDPALIPAGLTAKQVGLAVFDPHLDSWVPIMNAVADPKTQTVSGLAPHFSKFGAIVLDLAKSVVHVGGQVIHTVIDSTVTIAAWFAQVVKELTIDLLKDLTGIAPGLKCSPSSQMVTVSTSSPLKRLSACTESTNGSDVRMRLRNGFAFPMRSEKMPHGMALRWEDTWNNGGDVVTLVRNMFWMTQHKMVLSGADLGSVTVTADMQSTAKTTLQIDDDAVVFDIVLAVLSVVGPEATAAKAAIKTALKSALKGGKIGLGTVNKASAWVGQSYAALDCVIGAAHTKPVSPTKLFTHEGVVWASDVAHACLGNILSGLDLKGALADLLGVVKVIPETLETAIYHVVDVATSQLNQFQVKPTTATVKRNSLASYVGTWQAHGVQITISSDGSGRYTWATGGCDYTPGGICNAYASVTFQPRADGSLLGTYEGPITHDDPTYDPAGDGRAVGLTFIVRHNDAHTLITSDGTGSRPGNPYFCDLYAENHNDSSYQLCGA